MKYHVFEDRIGNHYAVEKFKTTSNFSNRTVENFLIKMPRVLVPFGEKIEAVVNESVCVLKREDFYDGRLTYRFSF